MNINSRYSTKGSGEEIILVHGMGGPIVWEPISELLAIHYKVIIPVFPGYLQEDGYIDYTDNLYVDFLEELRIDLRLDRLNLVGLSMGVRTVVNYTIKHPSKVSKLTIIDGVGIESMSPAFTLPVVKDIFPWLIRKMLSKPKNMMKLGSEDFVHKDSEVFLQSSNYFINLMKSDNVRTNFSNILARVGAENKEWKIALPKLKIPTLILWGEDDKTTPVKWAYQFNDLINDSSLHILQGYRHMAVMEKPEFFADKIIEFYG